MIAKRFFDTNVVIYAYDDSEPMKQAVARSLLLNAAATATGVISTQVLGEFFHATVVRRPLLTVANARTALRALSRLHVATIPPSLVERAVDFHERFQLRYWDALIIATAKYEGCDEVLSEDMNHGQNYDGVRVTNPFLIVSDASHTP
ncbi:MAG: PIN domain-containing protein [Planctomycetaceae bacterium]|nr:PIN domain-containing protein [Planctomycetaceae bacterium]